MLCIKFCYTRISRSNCVKHVLCIQFCWAPVFYHTSVKLLCAVHSALLHAPSAYFCQAVDCCASSSATCAFGCHTCIAWYCCALKFATGARLGLLLPKIWLLCAYLCCVRSVIILFPNCLLLCVKFASRSLCCRFLSKFLLGIKVRYTCMWYHTVVGLCFAVR